MRTIDLNKAQQVVAEGMNQTASERLKLQQERLHELVAYVREHSPYFAKLYASIPKSFKPFANSGSKAAAPATNSLSFPPNTL